jgi:hypothetical protein
MRTMLRLLPISLLLIMGCTTTATMPPFTPVAQTKQLMEWVIDPAADVVWDSVKTVVTEAGTKEIAPHTAEEWDAVRNGAAVLAESGNLLMMEGRARDRDRWMKSAHALTEAAVRAMKAAEAKNIPALFDAGGQIYNACSACHARYAAHLN